MREAYSGGRSATRSNSQSPFGTMERILEWRPALADAIVAMFRAVPPGDLSAAT